MSSQPEAVTVKHVRQQVTVSETQQEPQIPNSDLPEFQVMELSGIHDRIAVMKCLKKYRMESQRLRSNKRQLKNNHVDLKGMEIKITAEIKYYVDGWRCRLDKWKNVVP